MDPPADFSQDPPAPAGTAADDGVLLDQAQIAQVQRAIVFIEDHLGSELTLREIARVACWTPRHLQRVFQQFTGETVHDHIRRLRIERAAVMLRYCGLSVSRAALAVGFSNASGLYKAFQQRFGHPPASLLNEAELRPARDLPPLPVKVVELPPLRVAFLRHIGDPKKAVGTWLRLLTWARTQRLLGEHALLAGLNHDGSDTAQDHLRYDAAITVPPHFQPDPASGISVRELSGGLTVQHSFHGSTQALEERWDFLTEEWLPRSEWTLREPCCYDLYPHTEAAWPKLARLLVLPSTPVRATLCVPVRRRDG